jgi:hypothetical protein
LPDGKYLHAVLGPELEFVERTPDGEFVLRDDTGRLEVVGPSNEDRYVEVQCDRCARLAGEVEGDENGRWTCLGKDSDASCLKAEAERNKTQTSVADA